MVTDRLIINNNQLNIIKSRIIDLLKKKSYKLGGDDLAYKIYWDLYRHRLQVINCIDGSSLLIFNRLDEDNNYVIIRQDDMENAKIAFMTRLLYIDDNNNIEEQGYTEDDYRYMQGIDKIDDYDKILEIIFRISYDEVDKIKD